MKDFAKLFSAPDTGQVLVVLDVDSSTPVVEITLRPGGLVFSEILMEFPDSPEGVVRAIDMFKELNEERVLSLARESLLHIQVSSTVH